MIDSVRKRIAEFVLKLQSQTLLPLWSLADQEVIYAVVIKKKPTWGPKKRILVFLMKMAYKTHVSDVVLFSVGVFRASLIWLRVMKRGLFVRKKTHHVKRVFGSCGVGSEEYLYSMYLNQSQDPCFRINWVTCEGLDKLACPNLFFIFYVIAKNTFGYTRKLKKSGIEAVVAYAPDFLTVCAFNVGMYAFYYGYWRSAKSVGINEVALLVPDMPAFASVDIGIKTIFIQHRLLGLSILMPKFDCIDAVTKDEANYLGALLSDTEISQKQKKQVYEQVNNVIMVLLPAQLTQEEYKKVVSVIEWSKKQKLKIIVRETPITLPEIKKSYREKFPDSLFDDLTISLDVSLEKWKPKIVVAWWSTGLATALEYGSLPITFCEPDAYDVSVNMIYPLKKRVLF